MIYVAIGSNLPDAAGVTPLDLCRGAVRGLDGLAGLRLHRVSGWYDSAPVPPAPDQPRYVNGVVALAGTADPAVLLASLQRIEQAAGRIRGQANAARCLDLDIVDMAGVIRGMPVPILPHPRAHRRGFVLRPLLDVAPDWVHPTLGTPIATLLAALDREDVRLLSVA